VWKRRRRKKDQYQSGLTSHTHNSAMRYGWQQQKYYETQFLIIPMLTDSIKKKLISNKDPKQNKQLKE
jgi:hypothetical protein